MQTSTTGNSPDRFQEMSQPAAAGIRPMVFPSSGPVVIRIEQIWKQYRLGTINHGTLARDLQSWWARLLGREDPNLPLIQAASAKEMGDRFWALQDVSLDVCQGDVFGIIGKNGAGKSTLLKILSQVTAPTRGQVSVKGRIASLLEVGTGFHPELTGRENIFLNGAILGMSKQEIVRKLDEIIAFAEIDKFIDTPVKRYSSGMYVRLAFAVAAHLDPEILIVDEVLAVGDLQFQKKCLGKMEEVSGQGGRTILFVSHNLGMISRLCNKAMLLENGRVALVGQSDQIIEKYVQDFSGDKEASAKTFVKKPGVFSVNCIELFNGARVQTARFSCDDEIVIRAHFDMPYKIPGLYGFVALIKSSGEKVFVSDSCDPGDNCLEAISPGSHRLEIVIPRRTLGHGRYSITLDFASTQSNQTNHRSISVDTHRNVLNFSVDDYSTVRGNNREGYFSTIPKWLIDEATD